MQYKTSGFPLLDQFPEIMVNYTTTAMLHGLSEVRLEGSPSSEGGIICSNSGACSYLQHSST